MNFPLKITRDSGANLRFLKKLEKAGLIVIFDVMLENSRTSSKVKNKLLPIAVFDHSRWDEAVYAGPDTKYDEIRQVIGGDNIKDAMLLEAHLRSKNHFFITEDTDFLKCRKTLEERFGLRIYTPSELQRVCNFERYSK